MSDNEQEQTQTEQKRICKTCGEEKLVSQFYMQSWKTKSGEKRQALKKSCKKCDHQKRNKYRDYGYQGWSAKEPLKEVMLRYQELTIMGLNIKEIAKTMNLPYHVFSNFISSGKMPRQRQVREEAFQNLQSSKVDAATAAAADY